MIARTTAARTAAPTLARAGSQEVTRGAAVRPLGRTGADTSAVPEVRPEEAPKARGDAPRVTCSWIMSESARGQRAWSAAGRAPPTARTGRARSGPPFA